MAMDEIDRASRALGVTLNAGQRRACEEIMVSVGLRRPHLLTGEGGTGKTTVFQVIAHAVKRRKMKAAITAPTHKAVAVLASKIKRTKLDVPCQTVQSLLGLKPSFRGDRQVFTRDQFAPPVMADVVEIDEGSMLSLELMDHIERHLPNSAVVISGDDAQLPPVGERLSRCFATPSQSRLTETQRQDENNPVLQAARAVRAMQGKAMDWSWLKAGQHQGKGLFLPGDQADTWMRKAFTSSDFEKDPNTFRYAAWTNAQVARVNAKVRGWRYGDIDTPFAPGERALLRAPIVKDDAILANTNEEPFVLDIRPGEYTHRFPSTEALVAWDVTLPTWRVLLRNDEGLEFGANLPRDAQAFERAQSRAKDEAKRVRSRWPQYHLLRQSMAQAQSVYALTVHGLQGSTLTHIFIDVPELSRWISSSLLEGQQGLYVALSRPTHCCHMVGV